MGFKEKNISSETSIKMWEDWKSEENQCQPNYWVDVIPDSKKQCGPYQSHFATFIPESFLFRTKLYNYAWPGPEELYYHSSVATGSGRPARRRRARGIK